MSKDSKRQALILMGTLLLCDRDPILRPMTIRITQPVWDAISERGAFGETPDDVLRKVFGLPPRTRRKGRGETVRISEVRDLALGVAMVRAGTLILKLRGAPIAMWPLPDDAAGIAEVRTQAIDYAKEHGADQAEARIDEALASSGYAPPGSA